MGTLSPWEEGGVPRCGADISVLEGDTVTHSEEKKSSVVKHNRKTSSAAACQEDTCRAAAGVEVSHRLHK